METIKTETINSLPEMEKFTKEFLHEVLITQKELNKNQNVILGLSGDLGAGKTTFVQLLAKELGVKEVVTSPTFTIMKSYKADENLFSNLIHMDAYRIDDISELKPLRFTELLEENNNLICIEWVEKVLSILPKQMVYMSIELLPDNVRKISYKS